MVETNQLFGAQGDNGVGTPLILNEFDLCHRGGEEFDNGSNLAADKPFLGHILQYGYFGKKLHLARPPSH
jgi:hypothetical protein